MAKDEKQEKQEKGGDNSVTQHHHRKPGVPRGEYNAWQYVSQEEADRAAKVRKGKPVTGW